MRCISCLQVNFKLQTKQNLDRFLSEIDSHIVKISKLYPYFTEETFVWYSVLWEIVYGEMKNKGNNSVLNYQWNHNNPIVVRCMQVSQNVQ